MSHFADVMSSMPVRISSVELMHSYATVWGALRGTVEGISFESASGKDVTDQLRELVDDMYKYRIWDIQFEAVVKWGSPNA